MYKQNVVWAVQWNACEYHFLICINFFTAKKKTVQAAAAQEEENEDGDNEEEGKNVFGSLIIFLIKKK